MDKKTSKATTEVVKHRAFGIRKIWNVGLATKIGDPMSLAPPGELHDR